MPDVKEKIVPPQNEGGKKDIENNVTAIDEDDARKLFVIGRNRLLDVNHWHDFCGTASARFTLTNSEGRELYRTAEKGDYFKIAIPAPGPNQGEGFDWVQIEAIEDKSNSEGHAENIAIRVRPASNPEKKGEDVAHFFKDAATSTFLIERCGKTVTAAVYGRNEIPNTSTAKVMDNVRNAVVGTGAILGFSNLQWNSLVKGLLKT